MRKRVPRGERRVVLGLRPVHVDQVSELGRQARGGELGGHGSCLRALRARGEMSGGWLSKGCCTPVAADFFVKRRWSVCLIDASAQTERMYTGLVGRVPRAFRVYEIELAACKTLVS